MRINGVVYPVRYIGIDAPEGADYFAYQSTQMNSNLVYGMTVTLIKDVSETDQYDRLLRYVIVGEAFVNRELVYEGVARSTNYPPDSACRSTFDSAETASKSNKNGMWAPTPTPYPTAAPTPTAGNCHPSYPTVCIPPPPPDLDCGDIPYRRFTVLPPDPHGFDGNDNDGIGCESD